MRARARRQGPKAQQTRARILDAALALFKERGYEATTMRAVAQRAGVALGNAYYYFESKEHLIQAFYARTHEEHLAACAGRLDSSTALRERLRTVLAAKLETIAPYHAFAGELFRTAADPHSPLNPFSPESRPVRAQATALFAEAVQGARPRIPADLAAQLPDLLWLYHMGIILLWIHDESPESARTWRLTERTIDLIVKLVGLASAPLMRRVRKAMLDVVSELRDGDEKTEAPGTAR